MVWPRASRLGVKLHLPFAVLFILSYVCICLTKDPANIALRIVHNSTPFHHHQKHLIHANEFGLPTCFSRDSLFLIPLSTDEDAERVCSEARRSAKPTARTSKQQTSSLKRYLKVPQRRISLLASIVQRGGLLCISKNVWSAEQPPRPLQC